MSTQNRVFVFSLLLCCVNLVQCSGESKSYFDGIKDAMHSMKSFINTGLDGLSKLAKTIEVIEQFVDATIDEDCEPFTCPQG